MRLTEQEFLDLMAKKKIIRVVLPFRLPTWNQLLAMGYWQRKKIRDLIKSAVVSTSTIKQSGSVTVMDGRLRPVLTDLWLQEYYKTMIPDPSKKYHNRKRSQRQMKQL